MMDAKPIECFVLTSYLLKVIPPLLESDEDIPELVTLQTALEEKEHELKRFIEDGREHALSIFYVLPPQDGATQLMFSHFSVQLGVYRCPQYSVGAVITKHSSVIELDKPVSSQLRVLTISEDSAFETLHTYVKDAISPLFDSFVQQSQNEASEKEKLVMSIQKNMNDLAAGLLYLQQDVTIPEISLSIHPIISEAVQKAAQEDRPPTVEDVAGEHLSDSTFVNALQKEVGTWIKEIRKVTMLKRDISSGTTSQEISFWMNMEHALSNIRSKLDSPAVVLSLEVLKSAKRFHTVLSFDSDTGLRGTKDRVLDYLNLMKDFPIKDLLSADTIPSIVTAIETIFIHLKKLRNTTYPSERAVGLVEALSRDLLSQLLKALGDKNLLIITCEEFDEIYTLCTEVFYKWGEDFERFASLLRDLTKKRRDDSFKFHIKFNFSHRGLEIRLNQIKDLHHQHEQLLSVFNRTMKLVQQSKFQKQRGTLTGGTMDKMGEIDKQLLDEELLEIQQAYDSIKFVDCLDLSTKGSNAWDEAFRRYEEKIDKVESKIAARLRDQLGSARNSNEMFRIFSCYNSLLLHPHVQGAVREYQTQLLQCVREDIDNLHKKFQMGYNRSHAFSMCSMLDIPPLSSLIMWARQLEHQLDVYLSKVEAILGPNWTTHIDGQQLKSDSDFFRIKLNPAPLFEDWKRKVEANNELDVKGRVFDTSTQRFKGGFHLKLIVNFDDDAISLYKEVRNLRSMNFRIPFSISSMASFRNQLYPHAVCLKESIKSYEQICLKIADNQIIKPLVDGMKADVQLFIKEGIKLTWESYKLDGYVMKFSESVFDFGEKVDEALHYAEEISQLLTDLDTCEYSKEKLTEILDRVQKLVNSLCLHSYSNLMPWVAALDQKVEAILINRLSSAIIAWKDYLTDSMFDTSIDTGPFGTSPVFKFGGTLEIKEISHEFHVTKQVIHLEPPLELSRCHLIYQLHNWISAITSLQRIQSDLYQMEIKDRDQSYRSLLGKLMEVQPQPLIEAYGAIEGLMEQAECYVNKWLQYQSLWDMKLSDIVSKVGDNFNMWQHLLEDIKKSQYAIDCTETSKTFGPVKILYGKVQSKINLKHDLWYKEVLNRFSGLIGGEFHTTISKVVKDGVEHDDTTVPSNHLTNEEKMRIALDLGEKEIEELNERIRSLEEEKRFAQQERDAKHVAMLAQTEELNKAKQERKFKINEVQRLSAANDIVVADNIELKQKLLAVKQEAQVQESSKLKEFSETLKQKDEEIIKHQRFVTELNQQVLDKTNETKRLYVTLQQYRKQIKATKMTNETAKIEANELGNKTKILKQETVALKQQLSGKEKALQELTEISNAKIKSLEESLDDLKQQLLKSAEHDSDRTKAMNAKEKAIEELTTKLQLSEQQCMTYQEDIKKERNEREQVHATLTAKLEETEGRLNEKILLLESENSQLTEFKKDQFVLKEYWEEEKLVLTSKADTYSQQIDELKKELVKKQNKNKSLKDQLKKKVGLETEINQLIQRHQMELKAKDDKINELQCNTEAKETEIENLLDRRSKTIEELRQQLIKCAERDSESAEAIDTKQKTIEKLEKTESRLHGKIQSLEHDNTRLSEANKIAQNEIAKKTKSASEENKRLMDNLAEREKDWEEEKLVLTAQVNAYSRQCDELKKTLAQSQDKCKSLEDHLKYKTGLETEINQMIKRHQSEVKVKNDKISELERSIDTERDRKEHLMSAFQQEQMKVKELENRIESMIDENKVLLDTIYKKDKTISDNSKAIQENHSEIQELCTQLFEQERQQEGQQREQEELRQQLHSAQQDNARLQQAIEVSQQESSWKVKRDEISITQELLGEGAWAVVNVAYFRGTKVAAKHIHRLIISEFNKGVFIREMEIASKIRHPNLLQFIGATSEGNPIIIIELMPTSLRKELQKSRLTHPQIMKISQDVSLALNYLHLYQPHPIIHRDVSDANVLLEPSGRGQWKAKLSDYGSANLMQNISPTSVAPGCLSYAAPEAPFPDNHSPAMDVYSFGVLVMEMILHQPPSATSYDRERQAKTISWLPLKTVVQRCILYNSRDRPTIGQVFNELQRITV